MKMLKFSRPFGVGTATVSAVKLYAGHEPVENVRRMLRRLLL